MGYITTVLTPEERRKAGPKNGAQATATVALDPLGAVSVHVSSAPQGQGHRTVIAQIVADALGLKPADIRVVTELDTARDPWSIASGNYSSRFAAATGGAAHLAAHKVKTKLAKMAAAQLNVGAEAIEFENGRIQARDNPDNAVSFSRLAATSHWSPGLVPEDDQALRETVFWTPPELTPPTEADEINSSLCHGFICDFCGVEIDRMTGAVRIDRYVTMHDCGRILHPGHGDRPGHRRFCPCGGRSAVRGIRLRAGRQLPHRHLRRLSGADDDGSAGAADPAHGDALAIHTARRQRRRRRQLHEHAGLHRQRRRRCTRARRDRPAADAGEACRAICMAPKPRRPCRTCNVGAGQGPRACTAAAQRDVPAAPAVVWRMLLEPETLNSDHSRLSRASRRFRTRISAPT